MSETAETAPLTVRNLLAKCREGDAEIARLLADADAYRKTLAACEVAGREDGVTIAGLRKRIDYLMAQMAAIDRAHPRPGGAGQIARDALRARPA